MGEGKEQKKVTIENDFYIGKYPVTIAEYMHFVKDTKSHYPQWLEESSDYHIKTGTNNYYKKMNLTDNVPIIGVSWHDATAYCKWLSKKTGENYRLPTEKEWEYSCRAGTTTKWSFGDDEKELKDYAWYDKNSDRKTHEVGKKKKNPWGLYDMHGNVWEWCEDWYDEDKDTKVLRGGSWGNDAVISRSANRNWVNPSYRYNVRGFRLLRTLSSDLGDS
jgi:formylglycine-generating enzyme required for sulfatase activity